jgi:pimeloyl-ACP methyl ester carboxylesterase
MQGLGERFRSGDAWLRVRDQGAGAPLVMIQGWTLDLDAWEPQAAAFAASHRVVRYDRRGFGLSEGTPGRGADAEDLVRLVEQLGPGPVTLVGMSQGARVALAFGLGHPDRVSALVLDGPPDETSDAADDGDEDFSIGAYRRLVAERGVDAFRQDWRAHPLMRLHAGDAEARALVDRMLARYPARDLAGVAEPPPPPAGRAALARFAKPVLVMNGEFDTPNRRRAGEALAGALPLAERVVIAGAGHLPNLDAPRAYNEALQAFLRRQARAAA